MVIKHNNALPNNHFRKHWKRRVKTWFDQPGKKARRRRLRAIKAARLAPRPAQALRPVVQCPTRRYNRRPRLGRGFTRDELLHAGIAPAFARRVGIATDKRRRTHSVEGLKRNSDILKDYMSRLVLLPRRRSVKGKKLVAEGKYPKLEELDIVRGYPGEKPKLPPVLEGYRKISKEDLQKSVWNQLRQRKLETKEKRRALLLEREREKAEALGKKK